MKLCIELENNMIKLIFFAFGAILLQLGYPVRSINTVNEVLQIGDDKFNQQLWEKFQKDYKKSYTTLDENMARRQIFLENLKTINLHNCRNNTTFKMSINQFADMTFEELHKKNYIDREEFYEIASFEDFDLPPIEELSEDDFEKIPPESFDWRDHGINMAIKNQGLCGACYAFVGLEGLESTILIKTGKLFKFSPQEIVDCASSHGNIGCNGGIVHGVYSYINKKGGISLQNDYKFTENVTECNEDIPRVKFQVKGLAEFRYEDEELLKKALFNVGPLICVVDTLNDSFYRYSSGIYYEENCNQKDRNPSHVAIIIGYGKSKNGMEYWTVKNSYGERWGENGYVRIARNRNNHCSIASFNLIPIIDESQFIQEHEQLSRD